MPRSPLLIRRSPLLSLGVIVSILVAAVVAGVLGPDPKPKPAEPDPSLEIAERFPLGAGTLPSGTAVATDGDSPTDNTPVWFIRREGRNVVAERLDISDTRPRSKDFAVNLGRGTSSRQVLDVGEWAGRTAIFDLRLERGGIRSSVVSLGARGRILSRGFARLARPHVRRDVAAATWTGSLPDLFVIDRGRAREGVRITIFSGESGFRAPIATERAPFGKLDPDEWTFDVGRLLGRRPSLVAFSRKGTGSDKPEVHVLSGDSRFKQFILQRTVDRPRYATSPPLVTGVTLGRPGVFLIEGPPPRKRSVIERRRLLTVPIAAPQ